MLWIRTHRKLVYATLVGIAVALSLVAGYRSTTDTASHSHRLQSPLPATPQHELFPSKIWQSWQNCSDNPTERAEGFPQRWRATNPGWRYECIGDEAYDAYLRDNFDRPISDLGASLRYPIMRADLLRYLILLREGGVWADIDTYPHQPISRWIPDHHRGSVNLVVGIENDHHKTPIWPGSPYSVQLCQYIVLAKPNHPAIRAVVEQVVQNLNELLALKGPKDIISFEEVMATTGPFAFTRAIMDYFKMVTGVEHSGDELESLQEPLLIGDVLVLPKQSFGWLPSDGGHEKGNGDILGVHKFIGSWRDSHPG